MAEQQYYLVHANLAQARAPLDDATMKGFGESWDKFDDLAQRFAGFISQPDLPDKGKVYSSDMLLNVSIWEDVEKLERFISKGKNSELLAHRDEWFIERDYPPYVLYWFPAGEKVTEAEINERFEQLYENGPSPTAFTLERRFTLTAMLTSVLRRKPNTNLT